MKKNITRLQHYMTSLFSLSVKRVLTIVKPGYVNWYVTVLQRGGECDQSTKINDGEQKCFLLKFMIKRVA